MLTGVGTTAKGSVVDTRLDERPEEKFTDLDAALANMSGLQRHRVDVLNRKLVKKDLVVSHRQEIDDLITQMWWCETMELAKGEFLISGLKVSGSRIIGSKRFDV